MGQLDGAVEAPHLREDTTEVVVIVQMVVSHILDHTIKSLNANRDSAL